MNRGATGPRDARELSLYCGRMKVDENQFACLAPVSKSNPIRGVPLPVPGMGRTGDSPCLTWPWLDSSWTAITRVVKVLPEMKTKKLAPIHPGEILREEFMQPLGLSQNALARALRVPPRRINEIVLEKRGITADTALRLSRLLGTTAEMWTGLQADYDLRLTRYEKQRQIEREVEPLVALQPAAA